MVNTRDAVGASQHGQYRAGLPPLTSGAGISAEALKIANATRSLVVFSNTKPISPSDSESTEFFDAHEELPWTPDRPLRLSPGLSAAGKMKLPPWRGADSPLAFDPGSRMGAWNRRGSSADAADDDADVATAARAVVDAPGPGDLDVGEEELAVARTSSVRSLFPSKASMIEREDQRSPGTTPSRQHRPLTRSREQSHEPGSAAEAARMKLSATTNERRIEAAPEAWDGSVDDVEGHGEETSTASGTTITEGGWDSGHGDGSSLGLGAGAGENRKGRMVGGSASPPVVSKRSSFRRVLDSARTCPLRESRFKRVMAVGKRRSRSAANSASPPVDSGATSPEAVPVLDAAAKAHDKSDALSDSFETSVESRFLRRGTKAVAKGEGREGPPEVKMQHHGRGGGKGVGWRSMHMVQCLRYHEGPIWTLEFNRHGTRMATGGQDGKVVVWDVTIPPEQNQTASSETGVGSDGGESADESHTEDDTDDGTEHSRRSGTVGAESATGRDATESLSSASGLSDDVGSAGRASSDLGLDGSQKEQSFSQLEVFGPAPVRVFCGHKNDVVDLSWSHADFLCSASIDHTVMLWHPLREERLGTFTHPDFVTSVQFHPLDDHVFLTGCFDKRLRVWTIPDGRVMNWVQCQDMISAASFSPDGQLTAAGLYDGRVIFYHTTDLRYYTQIHCRNRHGSNRRGKKVTGLAFVETSQLRRGGRQPCGSPTGCAAASAACAAGCYEGDAALQAMAASRAGHGDVKDERLGVGKADSMSAQYSLLSTTNDSRLRIHDLDNFAMTCKFKGLVNDGIQIKASFSQDGTFVIAGSEDGQVYLWNSRQGRKRPSRSAGGSCPSSGGGGTAVPSCAAPPPPTAPTPPPATEGRVKSRTSYSFNVQCSGRPKVATVAVFFPPTALDAILKNSAVCQATARGYPATAGGGAVGAEKVTRKWRRGLRRTPSMPVPRCADASGNGKDNDGQRRLRRRRWSFAGQARFGVAGGEGGGGGGGAGSKARQQRAQTATQGKTTTGTVCSLSPLPNRPPKPWNNGPSPGEVSTARPSLDLLQVPLKRELPQPREAGAGAAAFAQEVWGIERKGERRGGRLRAIVSADYSGDIKVFLGLVDSI